MTSIHLPARAGHRHSPPVRKISPTATSLLLLAVLPLLSCGSSSQGPEADGQDPNAGYRYTVPDLVADRWPTGSLSQVGVDSTRLVQLMDELRQQRNHRVHAILLVKDGALVFEEYFAGDRWVRPGVGEPTLFTRDTPHY